jgi:hypothetical protein
METLSELRMRRLTVLYADDAQFSTYAARHPDETLHVALNDIDGYARSLTGAGSEPCKQAREAAFSVASHHWKAALKSYRTRELARLEADITGLEGRQAS